jgi:hypothetical protein
MIKCEEIKVPVLRFNITDLLWTDLVQVHIQYSLNYQIRNLAPKGTSSTGLPADASRRQLLAG